MNTAGGASSGNASVHGYAMGKGEMRGDGISKALSGGKGCSQTKGKGKAQRKEVPVLEDSHELPTGFSLRGAVLGRGGENFNFISEETGVRVWLSGKGSGREPQGPGPDSPMC